MNSRSLSNALTILTGAAILGLFAWYNRYPLLYSDLGTYLGTGFNRTIAIDRPITYGWLIRHLSLAESLYLSLIGQLIILSSAYFIWFRNFFPSSKKAWFIPLVASLSVLSSVSYQASMLLPDAFTSLLFIASSVLLFKTPSKAETIWMSVLLLFSIATHLSHGLILASWGAVVTIIILLRTDYNRYKLLARWWVTLILGVLIIPFTSLFLQGEFTMSKGSPVFFFAKLNSHGIVWKYLDQKCPDENLELCQYKDQLIENFLWDYSGSPLYKMGGWDSTYTMFDSVNKDILSSPDFLMTYLSRGSQDFVRQTITWSLDPLMQFDEKGPMYYPIERKLNPAETSFFLNARQNKEGIDLGLISDFQSFVYWISIVLILGLLVLSRNSVRLYILLLIIFLLVNAFFTGMLSDVIPRYQNRVIWLLPLVVIWGLSQLDWPKLNKAFKKGLNR